MADLSPAAQAVLDAVCDNTEPDCDTQHIIAAALRAAVDQTTRPDPLMGIGCIIYARDILAIANELEAP